MAKTKDAEDALDGEGEQFSVGKMSSGRHFLPEMKPNHTPTR
jgi:hypothetical protein